MRILITAGPTREAIDPVRFLSNRSSGKMGYAIAEAAASAGHEVFLISGPVALPPFKAGQVVAVETAQEMYDAVRARIETVDAAIFCAAVADYTPASPAEEKLKKSDGTMILELVRTKDILGSVRSEFKFPGILVGFAAETNDLELHAIEKLRRKGCDLLVGNDVSRADIGFGSDTNEVVFFFAGGRTETLSRRPKSEIAKEIIEAVSLLFEQAQSRESAGIFGERGD